MSEVKHIGSAEAFDKIIAGDKPVLVDFFATWCGPCQMMGPILDDMAENYKNADKIDIVKVDIDEQQEIAMKYGVMSVPTFIIFKAGDIVEKMVGARPQGEFEAKLDAILK